MLPIGVKRHAEDEVGVRVERLENFACLAVPDLDGPIRSARGEALAVRTERHSVDLAVVPEDERIEPAETIEVVPFPLPQALRTLVEQFQGPAKVVARQLPLSQCNAVEIKARFQFFLGPCFYCCPVLRLIPEPRLLTGDETILDRRDTRAGGRGNQQYRGSRRQARQRGVASAPPPGPFHAAHSPRHDRLARVESPQVLRQRCCRLVPLRRVLLEALQADGLNVPREP